MIADIPDTDTDTLEEAGFAIEGVAQNLVCHVHKRGVPGYGYGV